MKFKFINDTDFAGIIGALQAGRFDIIMSAMNDTAERRGKGVDFVDYFTAGTSILVEKGNPKKIKTPRRPLRQDGRGAEGHHAGQTSLTPQVDEVQPRGKPLNVLRFEKDTDALQQVKNGRAVADLKTSRSPRTTPRRRAAATTSRSSASRIEAGPVRHRRAARTNTQLRDALQAALKAIIADGTYDKILAKWNVDRRAR